MPVQVVFFLMDSCHSQAKNAYSCSLAILYMWAPAFMCIPIHLFIQQTS